MGVLQTAVAAGRWDLAAHALILATVKTLNGEADNAETDRSKQEIISNQATRTLC
jgi:hypothetical protein